MTKKYRHLLFDLDGTLTDPMEGITRSVQYALRHFGIEVSDLRELCPFIGPPFAESFRTFYGFDDRQTSEAVAVSREYFTEKGIFENRLYDGMDELLDTLASNGYTLCVATSKPRVFAERILDHFGIARYFSFVGGTGLDGSLPTKADVIAHVLAGSNITDRGTALMIGDRKYDILGAKTIGIDSAGWSISLFIAHRRRLYSPRMQTVQPTHANRTAHVWRLYVTQLWAINLTPFKADY